MKKFMPLKRVVVEITHEAIASDDTGIKKAVRSWHNRLAGGSIPRTIVTKFGRELFLDLQAWHEWLNKRSEKPMHPGPGRPRAEY
jgi:hypothetical protein